MARHKQPVELYAHSLYVPQIQKALDEVQKPYEYNVVIQTLDKEAKPSFDGRHSGEMSYMFTKPSDSKAKQTVPIWLLGNKPQDLNITKKYRFVFEQKTDKLTYYYAAIQLLSRVNLYQCIKDNTGEWISPYTSKRFINRDTIIEQAKTLED